MIREAFFSVWFMVSSTPLIESFSNLNRARTSCYDGQSFAIVSGRRRSTDRITFQLWTRKVDRAGKERRTFDVTKQNQLGWFVIIFQRLTDYGKKKKTNTHRPPRWNRNNIRRVPRARNVGTAATPPPWRARTCWTGSWTSKIAAQGTPERGSAPDSGPGRWARSTGCTTFFSCQYERERKKKLVISREKCWMKFRFEGRKT